MYNSRGKQISRVRRRVISNPRSVYQAAQRAVLTTVQKAYAVMQPLVSQSFQNRSGAWENQARFGQLNNRLMREKWLAQEGFTSPDTIVNNLAQSYNQRDTLGALPNEYIISEGTLSFSWNWLIASFGSPLFPGSEDLGTITYQDMINRLGVLAGDQITVAVMLVDDSGAQSPTFGQVVGFEYARIILSPAGDAVLTTPFFAASSGSGFTVNQPNERNKGTLTFSHVSDGVSYAMVTSVNGRELSGVDEYGACAAAGLILSRRVSNGWQYSTCQMQVRHDLASTDEIFTMGAAVESWQGDTDTEGTKYLEGAERNF